MVLKPYPKKSQNLKSINEPWFTRVYIWVSPSSYRDDWHPDVYRCFDSQRWVDTIASTGLDVVFLQSKDHAGMAYYQTEIDHTHIGLRGHDFLGELLPLFHQRGIRVVVNQSILFDNYLFNQHPDWRIRDFHGNDSKTIFAGGLQARGGIVCFNSPYRDLATAQVEALSRKYPIDGIFFDMLFAWIPVCYCSYCQNVYRRECNSNLPDDPDRFSPDFRRYVHWRNQKLFDFTHDLVKAFKTYRPEGLATFNSPRSHADRPSGLDRTPLADILSGDPTNGTWSGLPISFACNTWSNRLETNLLGWIWGGCMEWRASILECVPMMN